MQQRVTATPDLAADRADRFQEQGLMEATMQEQLARLQQDLAGVREAAAQVAQELQKARLQAVGLEVSLMILQRAAQGA